MMLFCPICHQPTARETHRDFPFCSERCRTLDLGNWAMEKYVVSEPVLDPDEPDAPSDTILPDPDEPRE
jgi:hypothetical protein